ncbi:MAG: hypothetical protein AAGI23_22130 [Bacteroidota bacterium]
MTNNQIKKYLELTETPTPPMHLEENVMKDIRNYRVRRAARMQSLRWLVILTLLSMGLLIVLFFYGDTLLSAFGELESVPDLSKRNLTLGAGLAFLFLLVFVDPLLSMYTRRKYQQTI